MKKEIKYILFAFVVFLVSMTSASARQMTLEEFENEVVTKEPDAEYVYIVGQYAFTSKHTLTAQDLMLAARSIEGVSSADGYTADDPIYGKMAVQKLERKSVNFEFQGWEEPKTVLGTTTLDLSEGKTINIRYIDYEYYAEKSSATVDLTKATENAYKNAFENTLKIVGGNNTLSEELSYDSATGKLTGLLLKYDNIDPSVFSGEDATGYYFGFVVEIPNATSATTVTLKGNNRTKTITYGSFDVQNVDGKSGLLVLCSVNPESDDKIFEVIVDLDGDGTDYGATPYTIDTTELRFQQASEMNFKTDELPPADVESIASDWGYTRTSQDTYKLEGNGTNKYKLTGAIVEQEIEDGVFSDEETTGYYFLLGIGQNLPQEFYSKAKVTYPGDGDTKTSIVNNETGVTLLFSVSDSKNKVKITVDLDGDENEYYPVEYEIDLSGVTLQKTSKFAVKSVDEDATASDKLKTDFGWEKKTGFETKFAVDGNNVTVTGLIPILDEFAEDKKPFSGDDVTGYYLPFVIETPIEKNNKTTVKLIHGEEEKAVTAESFDEEKLLYVLSHLDKDDSDKTFTVIVDMDGEGTTYAPYTLTFDWSGLKLQERTIPTAGLTGASVTDQAELDSYEYNSSYNEGLEFVGDGASVKLKGTLKEQVVSETAFGQDKINGYYFAFSFSIPEGIDREKVTITRLNGATIDTGAKKVFDNSEWLADGTLTILFRVPEDPKCKEDANNCKIYYSVDYDGTGNEYLPTIYSIDYSEATFQKSSLVKLDPIGEISGTEWKGFKPGENYSVDITEDSSTFKVTGLITIFDDKWTDSNPFTDAKNYYLAFKLSKVEVEGDASPTVKFLEGNGHDDENTITEDDLGENKSINVLKYLDPTVEQENKKFKITVDFDEGDEYVPYTITVDWSELDFQYETLVSEPTTVDVKATQEQSGYISDTDKSQLSTWGYSFENAGNFSITKEDSNYKLSGSVKEQKVDAGFNTQEGYYVPVKIYGPNDSQIAGTHFATLDNALKKWTVTVHDEAGVEKILQPTADDYTNGFLVVLFKLDKGKNAITYKIDWDGEGDIYLPVEVTINYEGLKYQTENQITFSYFDETTGTVVTDIKKVYQGETIDLAEVPSLTGTYHTFDYWYKDTAPSDSIDLNNFTTGEGEDVTLKAHYTLDADKFLTDVVTDLASIDTTNSQDFTSSFELAKDGTTITFDVKNPTSKLSILNDTSIPGAIAYILQRGEVKEITLSSGDKKVVFTKDGLNNEVSSISLDETGAALKEKIKAGAKALFAEVLEGQEESYTLNQMVLNTKDFSITIGALDDSVKLKDIDKTVYDFKFTSDIVNVHDEDSLNQALSNSAKTIYIEQSFEVKETVNIDRAVDINSSPETTLTSQTGNSIFKVNSKGVKIENLSLKAGTETKTLIDVENNGELTATNLKFVATDSENKLEAAIDVKDGGKLTASNLTYEKETYEHPIVRTAKTGATINLTNLESGKASPVVKEKIDFNAEGTDSKGTDTDYNYLNYYNDPKNAKIYTTVIYNYQGPYRKADTKYNYYGENLIVPTSTVFGTFEHYGETYTLIGFTKNSSQVLTGDSLPDGAVGKDELKVIEDAHYWAVFKVTLVDGVEKVSDDAGFKKAINNPDINAIYITDKDAVIDYGEEELKITSGVSIIGQPNSNTIIKAKKIVIDSSVDSVFINRVNLQIAAGEDQDSLIEVNGRKFALWQGALSNTSENPADYAIKYTNAHSVVDIRYMGTGGSKGFTANNITKSYVYVTGNLGEGSDLYLNNFPKADDNDTKCVITINGFAEDAVIQDGEDNEPDIRFLGNTVGTSCGMKLEKEASSGKADIKFGRGNIIIVWDETHNDFSGINLYANEKDVNIKYVTTEGLESSEVPQGVQGPTFKSQNVTG